MFNDSGILITAMFCSGCGTQCKVPNGKYCSTCGTKLEPDVQGGNSSLKPVSFQEFRRKKEQDRRTKFKPSKSKKAKVVLQDVTIQVTVLAWSLM